MAGGIYLWLFGVQTFCTVEAWNVGRKTTVVKNVPIELSDLSVSKAPGTRLSYLGYQFEIPWQDIDEAKTRVIGETKVIIALRSGNVLSVWLGSPHDLVKAALSTEGIDRNAFREIYGDEALQSDYSFHRIILEASPCKVTPFVSKRKAISEAMLVVMKAVSAPRGAESGVFLVNAHDFKGFQYGHPGSSLGRLSVELYSESASLDFIFVQSLGSPVVISQPDVNRVLATLRKVSSDASAESPTANMTIR